MCDKFIKVVKLESGIEAYIKSQWPKDSVQVNLQIFCSDNTIWSGNHDFSNRTKNDDFTNVKHLLQSSESSNENVDFKLDTRKLKFSITHSMAGDSQSLVDIWMKVDVRQVQVDGISSLLLESIQDQCELMKLQTQLGKKDRLIAAMQTRINETIRRADERDENLLPSVLLLLNSKKQRIRELEERVLQLENVDQNANSIRMQSESPSVKRNNSSIMKTPERKKTASPALAASKSLPGTPISSKRSSQGWITRTVRTPTTSSPLSSRLTSPRRNRTPQTPIVDFNFQSRAKRPKKLIDSKDFEMGESSKVVAKSPDKLAEASQGISGISIFSERFLNSTHLKRPLSTDKSSQSSDDGTKLDIKRVKTAKSKTVQESNSSNESTTKSSHYHTPENSLNKWNQSSQEICQYSQHLTPPDFDDNDGANNIIGDSQDDASSSTLTRSQSRRKLSEQLNNSKFNANTEDFNF